MTLGELVVWLAEHKVTADTPLVMVERHASRYDDDGYDDYGGLPTGRLIPLSAFDLRFHDGKLEIAPPPER